jgi:hypothetical protein
MQNDYLEMIEPTPALKTQKCKILSRIIWVFLKFSPYVATAFVWYAYDYFIAFFSLILSFLLIGIVRSKLRNIAIPLKQQEYAYSDKEISEWYTARELCVGYDD